MENEIVGSGNSCGDTIILEDDQDIEGDHTRQHDFGRLVPLNDSAREAFEELLVMKDRDPNWLPHERQFFHEPRRSDTGGFYSFNLRKLPRKLANGWVLGAGREGQSDIGVDILLTPDPVRDRIRGKHGQIYFRPDNGQLMIAPGPGKTIILNGEELKDFQKRALPATNFGIVFGNLAYRFEFDSSDAAVSTYRTQMKELMSARGRGAYFHHYLPESLDVTPSPRHFVLGNYRFHTPVAAGSFGVVSACVKLDTGDVYAAKRLRRTSSTFRSVQHELGVLDALGDHPHICGKVDVFYSDGDKDNMGVQRQYNDVWLILQPWAPLTLEAFLRDSACRSYSTQIFFQALQGVAYLHDLNFIHRDLKADNFLVVERPPKTRIVLTDFGHATRVKQDQDHTKGTITYLPPEIIALKYGRPEPYQHWSDKSDIFSLGLLGLRIVHGYSYTAFKPYVDAERHEAFNRVLSDSGRVIDDMLKSTILWKPALRPSANELLHKDFWPDCPTDAPNRKTRLTLW